MHNGCSGSFDSGKEIVDKIRMMGFNTNAIAVPFDMACTQCGKTFRMKTMETSCPSCKMVFGVTPCHSNSPEFVKPAGIDY